MTYKCETCQISFSRKNRLVIHLKLKHGNHAKEGGRELKKCPFCEIKLEDKKELLLHVDSNHAESRVFTKRRGAISDKVCIYQQELSHLNSSLQDFCNSKQTVENVFHLLKRQFLRRVVCRISITITADYEIQALNEENQGKSIDIDSFTLRSKGVVVNKYQSDRQIRKRIKSLLAGSAEREDDLLTRGSGWRFARLQSCSVLIYDCSSIF